MFVGIYISEDEISLSVIVKHVKYIGTIRAFCWSGGDLLLFYCLGGAGGAGGDIKIAGGVGGQYLG